MPILALDTATTRAVVGVIVDGRAAARRLLADGHAAQHALTAIDEALTDAQVAPRDLSRIAVGVGPGSFTGLRIGVATAQGLGAALGVPVDGASTLDALAGDGLIPVVDARRGEVFAAAAGLSAGAYDPMVVAALPAATLVGDGALRHAALFRAHGHVVPPEDDPRHAPDPARIALRGIASSAVPVYLRAPDAVPTAERA